MCLLLLFLFFVMEISYSSNDKERVTWKIFSFKCCGFSTLKKTKIEVTIILKLWPLQKKMLSYFFLFTLYIFVITENYSNFEKTNFKKLDKDVSLLSPTKNRLMKENEEKQNVMLLFFTKYQNCFIFLTI